MYQMFQGDAANLPDPLVMRDNVTSAEAAASEISRLDAARRNPMRPRAAEAAQRLVMVVQERAKALRQGRDRGGRAGTRARLGAAWGGNSGAGC